MSGSLPNPALSAVELVGSTSGTITLDTPAIVTSGTVAFVNSGTVAIELSGTTGNIGGGALSPGTIASGTVAITGATTSMAVVATPATFPGNAVVWHGYVSSAGTVTVAVGVVSAATPSSTAYNVRVIK